MKRGIKPNQSSIIQTEFFKVKTIDAIKIDAKNKSIHFVKIENCIDYIQKNLDFYKYEYVYIDESQDLILVGTDDDLKDRNSFHLTINNKVYYGDAIVTRVLKGGYLHKLVNTKLKIDDVSKKIKFM